MSEMPAAITCPAHPWARVRLQESVQECKRLTQDTTVSQEVRDRSLIASMFLGELQGRSRIECEKWIAGLQIYVLPSVQNEGAMHKMCRSVLRCIAHWIAADMKPTWEEELKELQTG